MVQVATGKDMVLSLLLIVNPKIYNQGFCKLKILVLSFQVQGANLFFNSSQFKFNIISSYCSWLFFFIKYDS